MDSYLEIAKAVLKEARQPLSARQILKAAYELQIVPRDLYGRTQHKTLRARLATDLLHRRSKSEFYRTGPGRFFLRAFQEDETLPLRYRQEYVAPLRAAQLGRFDVLTMTRSVIARLANLNSGRIPISDLARSLWRYRRMEETRRNFEIVAFRLMVILFDEGKILLRQKRLVPSGEMPSRTAVGFDGVVRREDRSRFSQDEAGLFDAAFRTVAEYLELAPDLLRRVGPITSYDETIVIFEEGDEPAPDDLMIILSFDCSTVPEIAEATLRGDIYQWQRLPISANDLDRFDRWSARIISDAQLQHEILP